MKNQRLNIIISIVVFLLLIPFLAMQFTDEVNWSLFDFAVMGILLLSTGTLLDLVLRKVKTFQKRLLLGFVVLLAFFLIWAELAVGIFGSPFAGS
ncbi:hypothetical protein C943_01369 [Mariniradius saccharolyticus AK6]|uniref:Uncharacterized protein n=1 Tax=Mariniradius saccharolyticus AK6 TaxID=1239962 RepID=M7XUD0_9BACT|nr:hypothetical protein [Mariniradius saccharolyticus]EMS32107.1 hypothetical protein C943_01369 [Mariniradius saccharolyticus AK6]